MANDASWDSLPLLVALKDVDEAVVEEANTAVAIPQMNTPPRLDVDASYCYCEVSSLPAVDAVAVLVVAAAAANIFEAIPQTDNLPPMNYLDIQQYHPCEVFSSFLAVPTADTALAEANTHEALDEMATP